MAIAYRHLFKHGSLNDDGSTFDMIGDYSSSNGSFRITSANVDLIINRVIITVEDGTINNGAEYGGITALTNGILFRLKDSSDNVIIEYIQDPIKKNSDISALCYDSDVVAGFSTGNDTLQARWTFGNSGHPLVLKGGSGDYLEVLARDNFTGLVRNRWLFQGYYQIPYRL